MKAKQAKKRTNASQKHFTPLHVETAKLRTALSNLMQAAWQVAHSPLADHDKFGYEPATLAVAWIVQAINRSFVTGEWSTLRKMSVIAGFPDESCLKRGYGYPLISIATPGDPIFCPGCGDPLLSWQETPQRWHKDRGDESYNHFCRSCKAWYPIESIA